MPLWPGSRTVTLIPNCGNSSGESPYSFANQHAAPLVSEVNHSASRTLTTNQPSVTGASPEPASSSRASVKNRIIAAQATHPDLRECSRGPPELSRVPDGSIDRQNGIVEDAPELMVRDAAHWRAWLAKHHDSSAGIWLVLAKKKTVQPTSLDHEQALEEALCHGWIDGQLRGRDADTYYQRFSRRRRRSAWSKRNIEIAERLIAAGRMHPAGIAELESARADGRSEAAYAGSASIEVPDDLGAALAAEPKALAMFENLSRQNRYAILYRITTAKRAETRERRIVQFVEMLARGETIHPQKRT